MSTVEHQKAGFLLDLSRCVGCGSCVLACRLENELPGGVTWRRVLPLNLDRHPQGPTYHFSVACHHCEEPACLEACPAAAYQKREDGVVLLLQERCVGCRYCEMACPFGAPSYDEVAGVMTKCNLCVHRLDEGGKPACVEVCPTGALGLLPEEGVLEGSFGDPPGFVDRAECRPSIRFRRPGGGLRHQRLVSLEERI